MPEVLIDLRAVQGAAGDRDDIPALLREGADTLQGARLVGLLDPDRPPLPDAARAFLHGTRSNAYAAGLANPACFVQLAPCDRDPLFAARLLLAGIPAVRLASTPPSGPGLARAVTAYWRARAGAPVPAAALWSAVAERIARRPDPPPARQGRLAVLTAAPDRALPASLHAGGAALFAPSPGRTIAPFAALSARYDRVLYLLGNTPSDAALVSALHRYGGAALLTESCLLAAYRHDPARAVRLARAELGREIPAAEWRGWADGIARPAALLLGEVAAAAAPLLVHSAALAAEIEARYGRRATLVPAPPGPLPGPATAGTVEAHAAGLAAESCVWALELLGFWGRPVRLSLLCPPQEQPRLGALALELGVAASLSFAPEPGAEIMVFSAMRGQSSLAAALAEAAGAGRRCIASRSVLEAIDAPSSVTAIPDQPSPPLLAAAIRTAWDAQPPHPAPLPDAAAAIRRALAA